MAEELLHLEQAHAALDELGREGVPERVTSGSTVTFDLGGVAVAPGAVDRLADRPVHRLRDVSSPSSETVNDTAKR